MRSVTIYFENKMLEVPDERQPNDYTCGVSAALAVLKYYEYKVKFQDVVQKLDPTKQSGTKVSKLIQLFKDYNFKVKTETLDINTLKKLIDSKIPVILPIQAWSDKEKDYSTTWSEGHYIVAIGYDNKYIYFEDPSLKDKRGYLTYKELDERWHDQDNNKKYEHFGIIVYKE